MSQSASADVRSLWAAWFQSVPDLQRQPPANQNAPLPVSDNDNRPIDYPASAPTIVTLADLIEAYRSDPVSPYHRVRYVSRRQYDNVLRRMVAAHGAVRLADIKARTILAWHSDWNAVGAATGHSTVAILRIVIRFGATMYEHPECARLVATLQMRFKMPKPRTEILTAAQATLIRSRAHQIGKPSIALAQAIQFEGILRQKDVIGEWEPVTEPTPSQIIRDDRKWVRGIQWQEIGDDLVLRHITSKRLKPATVDLTLAPMVLDEFEKQFGSTSRTRLPSRGPIILFERTGLPWCPIYFRQTWRSIANDCGIPKSVRNMDTRAGAITEATLSGAPIESIKQAAQHSDISMTQRYARDPETKTANVQRERAAYRQTQSTSAHCRDTGE